MKSEKRRITVGMLVSGLIDEFTISITKGAMRAAKALDVDMVVLPCKYLGRDLSNSREIRYEYQYNTMLEYARRDNLDALLIAADCIGCYIDKEQILNMLKRYADIPSVLVASKVEGYVNVNYDNYNGIKEGLEYLIHQLGCRRICMLGGPQDNTDALERRMAFEKVMKDNGIPFEERNYVAGTLSRYNVEVCNRLIDQNPDMEAVFCVNDETAVGLCEELKKRGIMPGKDVYVFGYDNTLLSAKYKPSLSTVWAEPSRLGESAMQMLLRMVNGEKVTSAVLPTTFLKRDSFGAGIGRGLKSKSGQEELFQTLMEQIIDLCRSEEKEEEKRAASLELLNRFLGGNALEYADIDNLMTYLEQAFKTAQQEKHVARMDIFVEIYRLLLDAMDHRFAEMEEEKESINYDMKTFVKDVMQFERGNDQSYQVLLEHLDWLGIHSACLYTYQRPILHLDGEGFPVPEQLLLKAVLKDGAVQGILPSRQVRSPKELFHNEMTPQSRQDMVLLPLFSNEMLYGVLLCNLTDGLFENGEFLVNQMGSAVKMMELLKENERISKSDGLTGLLNRRGFYDAAGEFLQECGLNHQRALAAYIDMDNLKIVNDRYGHDEGDFSLKLIGDILADTIGESGVVGRIGGDEFVLVTGYDALDEGEYLCQKLHAQFAAFNETSDKKYNIGISVGTYLLQNALEMDIQDALALADEKLYEEKKHRTRNVEKNV